MRREKKRFLLTSDNEISRERVAGILIVVELNYYLSRVDAIGEKKKEKKKRKRRTSEEEKETRKKGLIMAMLALSKSFAISSMYFVIEFY